MKVLMIFTQKGAILEKFEIVVKVKVKLSCVVWGGNQLFLAQLDKFGESESQIELCSMGGKPVIFGSIR